MIRRVPATNEVHGRVVLLETIITKQQETRRVPERRDGGGGVDPVAHYGGEIIRTSGSATHHIYSSSASFSGAAIISGELEPLQEGRTLAAFQGRRIVWLWRKNKYKKKRKKKKKRQRSRSVKSGEPADATFVIFLWTPCLLGRNK